MKEWILSCLPLTSLFFKFAKCKENILSFLAEYIAKVKIKISPYATDIKVNSVLCQSYLTHNLKVINIPAKLKCVH